MVARLVGSQADAIVTVSDAIADGDARARSPQGPVRTIANGSDFDDFAGLEYRPGVRADGAVPDHARRLVLRQARPAAVPDRARAASTASSRASSATSARRDREWAAGHHRPRSS